MMEISTPLTMESFPSRKCSQDAKGSGVGRRKAYLALTLRTRSLAHEDQIQSHVERIKFRNQPCGYTGTKVPCETRILLYLRIPADATTAE